MRNRAMIRALYRVGQLCGWLAERLEWAQWRLSYCEDCGRNKYSGAPCVGTLDRKEPNS